MKPQVYINDEKSIERRPIDDVTLDEVNVNTVRTLLDTQAYLAEGILEGSVQRREDIVERALEEDVFAAQVRTPGWFVNGDDELSEEHGDMHPGATLKLTGLVEDYSEDAWRVVAVQDDTPAFSFEYEWTFLPKSCVTLIRLVGIDSIETADEVSKVLSAAVDRYDDDEWDEMSWEEKLEQIEV